MSAPQIFLTRPEGRNGTVPARLQAAGMQVHELPALSLVPVEPPEPLPLPGDYDAVVFVSRYAVQRYLDLLSTASAVRPGWPRPTIAATVGAASARALADSGFIPSEAIVHPPADSPAQDSEALLAELDGRGIPLERALIVRGTQGREWLADTLSARGVRVDFLPVYERAGAQWGPESTAALTAALARPADCVFLMTSSEGVAAMARQIEALGLTAAWSKAAFVIIHERIGATLQSVLASQSGGGVERLACCLPDDDSIVQAILAVTRQAAKP